MGSFLEKPVTTRETESGESSEGFCGGQTGRKLRWATSAMQGWRVSMEDTHVSRSGLGDDGDPRHLNDLALFGVFDGHGGTRVAVYAAENLVRELVSCDIMKNPACVAPGSDGAVAVGKAIRQTFLTMDAKMQAMPVFASQEDHSGSTAACCCITSSHFVIGNCGDSRICVAGPGSSADSPVTVRFATVDHKPTSPSELARIENAGGSVIYKRVNGDLAMSRALGDFVYKANKLLPDVEQQVSAEPEISYVERLPSDAFVLVACDGIWDVLSNIEACAFVMEKMRLGYSLPNICEMLLDYCLKRGSKDNMTVTIIAMPGAPCELGTLPEESQSSALQESGGQEDLPSDMTGMD